jgi:hypothetical protein
MQPSRFERFDPVTVRAAARVIRIGWLGRLSAAEIRCFILHLADLHPANGTRAAGSLTRLAQRQAAFGDHGVPSAFRLRRCRRPVVGSGSVLVRKQS